MGKQRISDWVARLTVALVFYINVRCAIEFLVSPASYAGGFEIGGMHGQLVVESLGILFLMWNATYPLVIISPRRYLALYAVVLVQQLIGLIGEAWIFLRLPDGHPALAATLTRFIASDAFGLAIMAIGFVLVAVSKRRARAPQALGR
ncbi:MAG: hypothetical protein AB2L09_10255 [Coriobacteriia bacterium]